MELRNCKKCNRVFAYKDSDICSRCAGSDEDDFKKVKEYLYNNPGATIIKVAEETEVSEKKILRYLRESRIEIRESDNLLLDCERCGTPIRLGRFCDTCVVKMQKEFSTVLKPKEEKKMKDPGKQSSKMHIAEIRKRLR